MVKFELGKIFKPSSGENNGVILDSNKKTVTKGFKFVIKKIEDDCPNLAKKSFISFDEVLKKIKNKKNNSFIES